GRAAARASIATDPKAQDRSAVPAGRSRPCRPARHRAPVRDPRVRVRPPCAFICRAMKRPALRRRPNEGSVRPPEVPPAPPPPGARVGIRVLEREDRQEFLALARQSHRLHRPWTYPPERADQFDELYSRSRREDFVCLISYRVDTGALTGVFTISQ